MARIIAISNQKGGVGKSDTTRNLAHALAEHDQRVLIVDADGQCSLTIAVGLDMRELDPIFANVLLEKLPLKDIATAIRKTDMDGVDILPATPELATADTALRNRYKGEDVLANALKPVADPYDLILIDCPPNLSLLTTNALTAAEHVLLPLESDYMAFRGAELIMGTIRTIAEQNGGRPKLIGVVVTRHDKRTKHAEEMLAEIRRVFGDAVLDPPIPLSVTARDAAANSLTVLAYRPKSKVAMAHRDIARNLLMKYTAYETA